MTSTDTHKFSILIIEDEAGPRDALKMILRPFYDLYTADNAHTAMRLLRELKIDLVTLDLKLPDRQGVDLLQDIKLEREDAEVIIITGYGSLKSAMDGIRYGAAAYLLKPFNVTELISLINQTLEKKQRLDRLRALLKTPLLHWGTESEAAESWRLLSDEYCSVAQTRRGGHIRLDEYSEFAPVLSDLLEAKSRALFNHCCRVSCYAVLLGEHLDLPAGERRALAIGAFLHDIGRVGIDEQATTRPGGLGYQTRDLLQRHPEIGARMVLPLRLPAEVGQIISYHHEQYDGSGYPYGLQGDGIPRLARIVGIAQAFDHLAMEHPALHSPQAFEEAAEQIRRLGGSRFDPSLAELFARVIADTKASIPALVTSPRSTALPKS